MIDVMGRQRTEEMKRGISLCCCGISMERYRHDFSEIVDTGSVGRFEVVYEAYL